MPKTKSQISWKITNLQRKTKVFAKNLSSDQKSKNCQKKSENRNSGRPHLAAGHRNLSRFSLSLCLCLPLYQFLSSLALNGLHGTLLRSLRAERAARPRLGPGPQLMEPSGGPATGPTHRPTRLSPWGPRSGEQYGNNENLQKIIGNKQE